MRSMRWGSAEIAAVRSAHVQQAPTRYRDVLLVLLFPAQIFTMHSLSSSQTAMTAGHNEPCANMRSTCGVLTLGLRNGETSSVHPIRSSPLRWNPLRLRGGRKKGKEAAEEKAQAQAQGGEQDMDEEIEDLISQGEMLDNTVPVKEQAKEQPEAEQKPKQKVKVASLWRQISGQARHAYDFPSMDATADEFDGWKSDRHIISVVPNTTFFQEEQMVPFNDDDRFHFYEAFDGRYDKAVNVSKHSRDVEVTENGKRATVRLETGDYITDHILQANANGDLLNLDAIQANMTNTNWTAPPGWQMPEDNEDGLEGYRWIPPRTSYVTWAEPRTSGVSRWVLQIHSKEGPLFVGCLHPPHAPKHVRATKLKTAATFISDEGFAYETGEEGLCSLNHVVVGQTGASCWPPYFGGYSLLWITLDHDRNTLQVTCNSMPPFALFRCPEGAVPFVALRWPGDGVSLLSKSEAIQQVPSVQRNDVMARWSVSGVTLARIKEKETDKRKASKTAKAGEEEEEETYEFWPGGRLKVGGTTVDEEQAAMMLTEEEEEELEEMALMAKRLCDVTDDP